MARGVLGLSFWSRQLGLPRSWALGFHGTAGELEDGMSRPRDWHAFVKGLAVCAAYVVAAKLSLRLASVHPSVSPVWPPTGIAVATLVALGLRFWPAIFAGAFLVNITTAGSVATSLGIAVGNTVEGVLGAYLVERYAHGRLAFMRAPDVFRFAALAGLLAPAVSATIGVTSLSLGGYAAWPAYGSVWLTWWLGDVAGALLVAPLILVWSRAAHDVWQQGQRLETVLLFA